MRGISRMGAPASWARLRVFRYQQYRGLRREVVELSYLPGRVYLHLLWFCFTGQPRTVQEYVRVRVQSPAYIGYSPTDDLSVHFRKMGRFVSDSFGGVLPNKVYATLEIRGS